METAQIGPSELIKGINKEANSLKISYIQKPKPTAENWQELIETYKISHNKKYEVPPVCLEIIGSDGGTFNIGSLGNFSAIIGRAKSRKTFSICLYLAAAIKKDCSQDHIRASLPKGKQKVILIDTEQSEYDVSKVSNRILTLSEQTNPENFEVYSFRALSPADRLFMIERLIYKTDDLGILVIDGIRDLISDINSPEDATMISSKLLKWTQERNIHIIVVIHQNKGDNNARGHIGTELINKAESVISVEKDNELSIVRPEFIRGKDFEPFAFSVDPNGIPYILDDWTDGKLSGSSKPQKLNANNIADSTHLSYLKQVFINQPSPKYSELLQQIKLTFQAFGISMGDNKIREYIIYYQNKGWLTKDDSLRYPVYKFNSLC